MHKPLDGEVTKTWEMGESPGISEGRVCRIEIKERRSDRKEAVGREKIAVCTAVTYQTKDFYMGRTLDYEFSYGETIVITPRNYPLPFHYEGQKKSHFAMIGTAHIAKGYPLYYDAVNEKGLGMAGLNFVGNAVYREPQAGRRNAASYEFIPWVLSQCGTLEEARELLAAANLTGAAFDEQIKAAQLHWMIADASGALTVEALAEGWKIYENPVGVLTNNPPFDMQLFALNNYMRLSPGQPENLFSKNLDLQTYSRGMGALGLPGDLSSASRFVRAAFVRNNSISGETEEESVGQFFHILGAVEQQRGCCEVSDGKYEITIYASCWNAQKGIYYYTTYGNHQISAVDMNRENLESRKLISYEMR